MVVNAVLDDASTKTYVNSDVAAELGLNGKSQKVKVNVLNGHVETLDTTPIEVILQSTNEKINMKISTFTTERVTGSIGIIEWKDHAKTWSHLKGIKLPRCGSCLIIDVLIGTDYADLHFSHKDVRGNPGEPMAQLTPLGWTCVGNPNSRQTSSFHTNFARTHLALDSGETDEMNSILQKFWEIENSGTALDDQSFAFEEKQALEKVKGSLKFKDDRYELAMPWKQNHSNLPNNYSMALKRLLGTEIRLLKNPEAGEAYSEIIKKYLEKVMLEK